MRKTLAAQFSQSAMINREKEIFPSQPKTNPKGETPSGSAFNTFKKVNIITTLRSRTKIDNHVGNNLNENLIHLLLLLLIILESPKRMSILL